MHIHVHEKLLFLHSFLQNDYHPLHNPEKNTVAPHFFSKTFSRINLE